MTELVIRNERPSDEIVDHANEIDDTTAAETVRVENAVDNQWFIIVSGPAGDDSGELTETDFEDMLALVEDIVGSAAEIKPYYELNRAEDEYLIRIEY